jgi:hypothetical protein
METKKNEQISVDKTLRFLYGTLRNTGAELVAIEFKHRGKSWRADTIEEALALRNTLEEADRIAIECGDELESEEGPSWTPDVFTELLRSVGEHQKSFLRALYEHREGLGSDQIVKELSLESEVSLAGVLSGLSKQSKKLGIMPWKLYEVQVTWRTKGKTRFFKLSRGFRWAADELGWPENWI